MRKMERILGGNIMWVSTLEGVDGYIQNYFNIEKNEWETRHIDNIRQIFDIKYNEDLCLDLTNENIKSLVDNNLILFDTELNFYKLSIYDKLFQVANSLITKYIKDNNLDTKLISDAKDDNYFSTLWGITIDVKDNVVRFNGISNYIEDCSFKFPLHCITHIIDISKLKSEVYDKFDISLKNIHIKCMQYHQPNGEWLEDTIYVVNINDDTYYTYNLFKECDFIK